MITRSLSCHPLCRRGRRTRRPCSGAEAQGRLPSSLDTRVALLEGRGQAPGSAPDGLACERLGRREQAERATRSTNYWSASTLAPNPTNAWIVNFNNGNVNNNDKTNNNSARLVRGGS